MRVLLVVVLLLSGCGHLPNLETRTPKERLLIVCEAWASVFRRIDLRDQLSLASDEEIAAVDAALPVLNPVCTSSPGTYESFDVATLESVLIRVLTSEKRKETNAGSLNN